MKGKIISLQYLRGIAALLVVFHHIFSNRLTEAYEGWGRMGSWGVDIFFVISGFIIYQTVENKEFRLGDFAARRFARIFPLYWIALTIWILARMVLPDRLGGADVSAETLFFSYLLIPHYHLVYSDCIWPILIPGWTLQLELTFYFLLALVFWAAPRAHLGWLMAVLAGMATLGALGNFHNPLAVTATNTLLLEFAGGVLLATQMRRLQSIPPLIPLLLVPACVIVAYFFHYESPFWVRALVMGGPAFVLVGAMLSLEGRLRKWPVRLLERLGDASYSLYLFHPMMLGFVAVAWAKLGLPVTPAAIVLVFVPMVFVLTSAMALVLYAYLEKPLLRRSTALLLGQVARAGGKGS